MKLTNFGLYVWLGSLASSSLGQVNSGRRGCRMPHLCDYAAKHRQILNEIAIPLTVNIKPVGQPG